MGGPAANTAVVDGDTAALGIVTDAFGKTRGLGRNVHDKPMQPNAFGCLRIWSVRIVGE